MVSDTPRSAGTRDAVELVRPGASTADDRGTGRRRHGRSWPSRHLVGAADHDPLAGLQTGDDLHQVLALDTDA